MSAETFFDLALVTERLNALVDGGQVAEVRVASASRLDDSVRRYPSLFVASEQTTIAGQTGMDNCRLLTEVLVVSICVQRLPMADDGAATAELTALRASVWNALEGYRPDGEHSPLRYQSGSLLGVNASVWTWIERYVTQRAAPLGLSAAANEGTRDWRKWPFSQRSPWNHPIGSDAQYAPIPNLWSFPAGINYADRWTSSVAIASPTDEEVQFLFGPTSGPDTIWNFLDGGGLNCGNPPEVDDHLISVSTVDAEWDANFYSTIDPDGFQLPPDYRSRRLDNRPTFRLPAGACPSPDSDGLFAVIQPDGWAIDIYDAIVTCRGKVIGTMASWIDLRGDGTGWWNGRRASMIPSFAGLIRNGELSSGLITHALLVTAPPATLTTQAVWPAYAFDRNPGYSGTLPMGSLLAIPPSVDITTLGLSPKGQVVARAAQDYGVYVADRGGGGFTFLAELGNQEIRWYEPTYWWDDIEIIKNQLMRVTNNTAQTPGGGGTPRAPFAPPFMDGAGQGQPSIPYLDPALLLSLLTPLLGNTQQGQMPVIRDLRVLGNTGMAAPGAFVRQMPGIAIVPTASMVSGAKGKGNGRLITETVSLVIQATQFDGQDASAFGSLRTIRSAVFALLEGYRPDSDHTPLRYQGGSLLGVDAPFWTWVDRYSTQRSAPAVS